MAPLDDLLQKRRASTPSQPVTRQKTPSRPPMKVTAHRSINSQPGEQVQYFFMHVVMTNKGISLTKLKEHLGQPVLKNMTEYELARVRKIQQNREFLNQQEMLTTSNTMADDNAVLVASQWWQSQCSARVCITGIIAQIDGHGIPRPKKKNCTLRELLIHFGNSKRNFTCSPTLERDHISVNNVERHFHKEYI